MVLDPQVADPASEIEDRPLVKTRLFERRDATAADTAADDADVVPIESLLDSNQTNGRSDSLPAARSEHS